MRDRMEIIRRALESVNGCTIECHIHGEHDPGCWYSRHGRRALEALRELGAELEAADRELAAFREERESDERAMLLDALMRGLSS